VTGDSRILFFVKAPLPGMVKTRLAKDMGEQEAAELYKLMAEDALAALAASGRPVQVCFTPEDQGPAVARWLGAGRRYVPQQGSDLGRRMEHAFASAFASGARQAVLVGSDIPELKPEVLHAAFAALRETESVLAPAGDGGYTLIGFRRESFKPEAFHGMAWGGPDVFADTLSALEETGCQVTVLEELRDVDELADLQALYARGTCRPSRTMGWLERHAARYFDAATGAAPSCKIKK